MREHSEVNKLKIPAPCQSVSPIEEMKDELETLMTFRNALQQGNCLKEENGKLSSEIEALQDEKERLRQRHWEDNALRTKRENLKRITRMQVEENKIALKKGEYLKQAKLKLVSEIEALKSEKESRCNIMAEMTEFVNRECSMTKLVEENIRAVQEIISMKETKRCLESLIKKIKDEQKRLHEREEENKELRSKYNNMKSNVVELEGELSNVVQESVCLKEVKELLDFEIKKLKDARERLCKRNTEARTLKIICEDMKARKSELAEKVSIAVRERDRLKTERERLELQFDALKVEEEKLCKRDEENGELRMGYCNLKHTKTQLEEGLYGAFRDTARLIQEIDWLTSKSEELEDKLKLLRKRDKESKVIRTEFENMKHNMADLVQEFNIANQNVEHLKDVTKSLASIFENLEKEQKMLRETDEETKALSIKYDSLKRRVTELVWLKNSFQEMQCLNKEKENLASAIEKIKGEMEMLSETKRESKALETLYGIVKFRSHELSVEYESLKIRSHEYINMAKTVVLLMNKTVTGSAESDIYMTC